MSDKVLFVTLRIFSTTGGIEKVSRVVGKALFENSIIKNYSFEIYSMYDSRTSAFHNNYFPIEIFRGYEIKKWKFMADVVRAGIGCKTIIISHINLLPAVFLIKKIKPSVKTVLLAHGIEVWNKMNYFKSIMLQHCDEIASVSNFTKSKIIELNNINPKICSVLNNCLDPFLTLPKNIVIPGDIRSKYGLSDNDKVLFTLTRISAKDRFKGYDKVIEALIHLPENIKYLIAGKYDEEEKNYILSLINKLKLNDRVVLTGFLSEKDLASHFSMADCYVMPSIKEGFGIVFIEAMYYGLPVIAGNRDGSVDALANGEFGVLIDPSDVSAITAAIQKVISDPKKYMPDTKRLCEKFSYVSYKSRLNKLMERNETVTA